MITVADTEARKEAALFLAFSFYLEIGYTEFCMIPVIFCRSHGPLQEKLFLQNSMAGCRKGKNITVAPKFIHMGSNSITEINSHE